VDRGTKATYQGGTKDYRQMRRVKQTFEHKHTPAVKLILKGAGAVPGSTSHLLFKERDFPRIDQNPPGTESASTASWLIRLKNPPD
jgi:hypothetical protein